LFQHPRYGKRAAELAVRVVKRGRKYGIILLFATQSPTKDSIPKEITRNVTCGVAFSVADHIANDGLLGSGRYAAGIRATELRAHTDRGTCVTVGVTDAIFELIRTFYIPFDDGTDDVTPIIQRAMGLVTDGGRALPTAERLQLTEPPPPDHLVTIAEAMQGEPRVRTQVILARLIALNPTVYEGWTLTDLRDILADHGITVRKSDGLKVIRAEDLTAALHRRETSRDTSATEGLLPDPSLSRSPRLDQQKPQTGTAGTDDRTTSKNPQNHDGQGRAAASLPDQDCSPDLGEQSDHRPKERG
jgi:S-DNA-T family DNA segregation ATPase FtsK/SpoIIIE